MLYTFVGFEITIKLDTLPVAIGNILPCVVSDILIIGFKFINQLFNGLVCGLINKLPEADYIYPDPNKLSHLT
jgi:hypothetical protein